MGVKTAIVAEGGGQRGIYTAGILDLLLEKDLNPFDIAVGASAGAQNLLAYSLKQHGYAKRMISELTAQPDFLVPGRCLLFRSMLNLDDYFNRSLQDPEYRLPYHGLSKLKTRQKLIFIATDKNSLEPVYLEPGESTALAHLKASSAVPLLYRKGVECNNRLLIDGGIADPLPVQYAYEQGARRIFCIRTMPGLQTQTDSFDKDMLWCKRLTLLRRFSKTASQLLHMIEHRERRMQASIYFILHPPSDLDLQIVSPEYPLKSQLLSSDSDALARDYLQGRADGQQRAETVQRWHTQTDTQQCA